MISGSGKIDPEETMTLLEDNRPWCDEAPARRDSPEFAGAVTAWPSGRYERVGAPLTRTIPIRLDVRSTWLVSAIQRIASFSAYPENWNGFGERRITDRAVISGAKVLSRIAVAEPPTAVVPLATGGVQIEWGDTGEVIVEVMPDGRAEGYLVGPDVSWPLTETADFVKLLRFIAAIA